MVSKEAQDGALTGVEVVPPATRSVHAWIGRPLSVEVRTCVVNAWPVAHCRLRYGRVFRPGFVLLT